MELAQHKNRSAARGRDDCNRQLHGTGDGCAPLTCVRADRRGLSSHGKRLWCAPIGRHQGCAYLGI